MQLLPNTRGNAIHLVPRSDPPGVWSCEVPEPGGLHGWGEIAGAVTLPVSCNINACEGRIGSGRVLLRGGIRGPSGTRAVTGTPSPPGTKCRS